MWNIRPSNIRYEALIAACCLLLTGCVTTSAPRGWLPAAEEARREAFGGWAQVTYEGASGLMRTQVGELIAVAPDTLFILFGQNLYAIPRSLTLEAQVVGYDAGVKKMGAWFGLGQVSTLTHGFVLILTAPVWAVGGVLATVKQSRLPAVLYPGKDWTALRVHARFPQGLPPSLDRSMLRPKQR